MLQDVFGYHSLRAGQLETSLSILVGEDVIVRMSTSGGKSLCYQLPALAVKDKCCFVICPLNSIMNEQISIVPRSSLVNQEFFSDFTSTRQVRITSVNYISGQAPLSRHPSKESHL